MSLMRLSDGGEFEVRPIRPDDKRLLAEGHARLSPETVRRRYLTAKPRLTSADLRYLTEVDGHDHVAFVALPAGRPEAIVAVGRFVRDPEQPDIAEFAIVVGDAYQRRGLGTALAGMLAREARRHGIQRMRAVMLSDNVAAQRLVEHITERLAGARVTGATRDVVLDLAA